MNISNNNIENDIKKLNAIKAMRHRDFNEIEKRYDRKEISNKNFEKHKRKYDSRIEKIKEKIRRLEEKSAKRDDGMRREKRYLEWSGKK